jgi:dihydrofolate reductase
MAKLIYSAITSLDGYVADEDGKFDWSMPDAEVMRFLNEIERPVGTYLYGRGMYEVMAGWETASTRENRSPTLQDFTQLWQAADKVVYSRTLGTTSTTKTRLERDFDVEAIRKLKADSEREIAVGGPELAGQAIKAGLVDELQLFFVPVLVGGGTRSLPDDVRLNLDLLDEHRFGSGAIYLHYRALS